MVDGLTERQRETLQFIAEMVAERGYPPSVREIGEALGLASCSTVHSHLQALQRKGYLKIDPTKPRAIEVLFDIETGLPHERRPARSVPLLGRIAAGTPDPRRGARRGDPTRCRPTSSATATSSCSRCTATR